MPPAPVPPAPVVPAPAPPAPSAPGPAVTPAGVELVDLTSGDDREPLPIPGGDADVEPGAPMVSGIHCKRGHFNRPDALYCGICGIAMVHETHVPVQGPRPNLGHIVFDDGAVYQLTRDYVIGSDPSGDPGIASGEARPLEVTDDQNAVSRVHSALLLREWDVYLEDRDSTNGTWLWSNEANQWQQLTPFQPVLLESGIHVSIGQRSFKFEPANRR